MKVVLFTQSKKFSLDLQFNFVSTSTVAKNSGQKKTQQAVTFGVKTSQFFACFIREKKSHSSFLEIITVLQKDFQKHLFLSFANYALLKFFHILACMPLGKYVCMLHVAILMGH